MNNDFNQPVGQPVGQPMGQPNNGSFNVGGKQVNKNTAIIGVVAVVVVAIIAFIAFSGSGKSQLGEWDCGNLQVKIEKSKVTLKMGSAEITGKYTNPRGKANESSKKSGYTYKNYEMKNATNGTTTKNIGFTFGVSKDGKEAHYIDGLNQVISSKYECKKK